MAEHSTLTDPDLHEPKGVATAAADKVYVSDGAGGGSWKTAVTLGWENASHGGASQSLSSGVRTKLLCDSAGFTTEDAHVLPGAAAAWEPASNHFMWTNADLGVGDTVDLRLDLVYTADTNNDGFLVEADLAVGGITPFTFTLDERNVDTSGVHQVLRYVGFFTLTADVINNPTELYVTADSGGDSVLVRGWYARYIPISPRYM